MCSSDLGPSYHYREQLITALVGSKMVMEQQGAGGMILGGQITISTKVRLTTDDQFKMNKITYNVASDPALSKDRKSVGKGKR